MFQILSFLLQVSLRLNLHRGSASFYLKETFTKYEVMQETSQNVPK